MTDLRGMTDLSGVMSGGGAVWTATSGATLSP